MSEISNENNQPNFRDSHFSELYKCYNGIMMGYFISGAFGKYVEEKYPFVRNRIREVLNETGIESFSLPENYDYFVKQHAELCMSLALLLHQSGNPLSDYYFLGAITYMYWVEAFEGETETSASLKELIDQRLEILSIPKHIVKDLLHEMVEENKNSILDPGIILSGRILNNKSLKLLNILVGALPFEEKTCFVSMPFKQPYTDYFSTFYSPAIQLYAPTTIRAWGGFGSEEYQSLMFTLIEKCGFLMADISEINPNVIIEFAYAWGFKKSHVFLTANIHLYQSSKFSNISDTVCYQYNPDDVQWPLNAIMEFQFTLSATLLGKEMEKEKSTI